MTFHLKYVKMFFSSVYVAEWPPFRKELPVRLTLCSLRIISVCNFSYFPFRFEGRIWDLIAPIPGHCLLVSFN